MAPAQPSTASPIRWFGEEGCDTVDRSGGKGASLSHIAAIDGRRVLVRDLEAFDGTPIVDVKPVLDGGR